MNRLACALAASLAAATLFAGFAGRDPRGPGFAEENFALPLRVMTITAHPDDSDFECAATAIKLARAGARVQFVAVCNGDNGHQTMKPVDLAARRYLETQAAAKAYGIEKYVVMGEHDCLVEPTLDLRKRITRMIRAFAPHVIITHRTCDYHADHRAVAQAVQDATYLLGVPLFCPEAPVPETLPCVFFAGDTFTVPRPFRADMVVIGDDVEDQMVSGWACHESQVFEWLVPEYGLTLESVPKDAKGRHDWLKALRRQRGRTARNVQTHSEILKRINGGRLPFHADVYELSEYGRKPAPKEIAYLKSLGFHWLKDADIAGVK